MNALKNTIVVAADQEIEDIMDVTEDQHTVVGIDSEMIEEEEEDQGQDPEATTPETNTTEEEETIPEREALQVVVIEDKDQEEVEITRIAEAPLTADLLLGPTTAEVDPQGPEMLLEDPGVLVELDQMRSLDREAEPSLTASTVIAEVAHTNQSRRTTSSTMNTAAEELDLTVLVRRPTEDKVVTAEVPLTESKMTKTSTVETTTAVNSEEKNKRSPQQRKFPTEKTVFKITACPSSRRPRDPPPN